jgi:methylphosphotriester-DNA--protein-cysteine methyltransferase
MRKVFSMAMVFVFVLSLLVPIVVGKAYSASEQVGYVAAESGERYHRPDCAAVKRIKKEHRVTFGTAQEAIAAGYTPCKVCKPPERD